MQHHHFGTVQQKIKCVFETKVIQQPSTKRNHQPYCVVATSEVRSEAVESNIESALASEKLDGTCVYINTLLDKPWLWARHDRKLGKTSERQFRRHQNSVYAWEFNKEGDKPQPYDWKIEDFKTVPTGWVPADGVEIKDGITQPDNNGHIPGWVPVDPASKQHVWHLSAVDLSLGLCLILRPENGECDADRYEIALEHMDKYVGYTLELIGTHINGNPYKIGSKQHPLHVMVVHGSIPFQKNPPLDFDKLSTFFQPLNEPTYFEGIVWHCSDRSLYKLHCYHLNHKWPPKGEDGSDIDPKQLRLNSLPCVINCPPIETTEAAADSVDYKENVTLQWLIQNNGVEYPALCEVKP